MVNEEYRKAKYNLEKKALELASEFHTLEDNEKSIYIEVAYRLFKNKVL